MIYIKLTREQIAAIYRMLDELSKDSQVSELELMYNPVLQNKIIVRYVTGEVTLEGAATADISYWCVDTMGKKENCVDTYSDSLYFMLKDYRVFKLTSPLIKIV